MHSTDGLKCNLVGRCLIFKTLRYFRFHFFSVLVLTEHFKHKQQIISHFFGCFFKNFRDFSPQLVKKKTLPVCQFYWLELLCCCSEFRCHQPVVNRLIIIVYYYCITLTGESLVKTVWTSRSTGGASLEGPHSQQPLLALHGNMCRTGTD